MAERQGMALVGALAASVALTVVGAIWVVTSAGGGHGSYVPYLVLFPFSALSAIPAGGIGPIAVVVALAQFPAYAVFGWHEWKQGRITRVGVLIFVHASLATFFCLA